MTDRLIPPMTAAGPDANADAVARVTQALAQACIDVSDQVAGACPAAAARAEALLVQALAGCPDVAAWASAAQPQSTLSPLHAGQGTLLVSVLPLQSPMGPQACEGLPASTLFSIWPHRWCGAPTGDAGFLQPARQQRVAGCVLHGAVTVLMLTAGQGVLLFRLVRDVAGQGARWCRIDRDVRIEAATRRLSVQASNQRFWEKPVQRYVAECMAGDSGPRMKDFEQGWSGSLGLELFRLLTQGGVLLHPRDLREPRRPGRVSWLFKAAPMAMLTVQAAGRASTGTTDLLALLPEVLHQQVPLVLGAAEEIERIEAYHADPHENVSWQLFKTRSLFVQPQA